MTSPIVSTSNATIVPPTAAKTGKAAAQPAAAAPAPSSSTTVTLSKAALAAAAAAKEALETPAQTAQEARGNDLQAQRLLAKEKAVSG